MKPDWKDAPTWANWLAMDDDGTWYWYEELPVFSYERFEWGNPSGRRARKAFQIGGAESLEPRP